MLRTRVDGLQCKRRMDGFDSFKTCMNQVTIRNSGVGPIVDEFAEMFAGRAIYSMGDLYSSYYQFQKDVDGGSAMAHLVSASGGAHLSKEVGEIVRINPQNSFKTTATPGFQGNRLEEGRYFTTDEGAT